jgi:hypothetical protein
VRIAAFAAGGAAQHRAQVSIVTGRSSTRRHHSRFVLVLGGGGATSVRTNEGVADTVMGGRGRGIMPGGRAAVTARSFGRDTVLGTHGKLSPAPRRPCEPRMSRTPPRIDRGDVRKFESSVTKRELCVGSSGLGVSKRSLVDDADLRRLPYGGMLRVGAWCSNWGTPVGRTNLLLWFGLGQSVLPCTRSTPCDPPWQGRLGSVAFRASRPRLRCSAP